jgi:hypothetical protein
MSNSVFSRTSDPSSVLSQKDALEEVTKAGREAIRDGDWARAESHFREAVKIAPTQGFWRIQLVIVLGQQKKWKAAFDEMAPLSRNRAIDWIVAVNQKLPDGKVAFVDTAIFGDEQKGLTRYVEAVKEKKNVDSVWRDIRVKLDAFARQRKIALMYDNSKFKAMPFESGNTTDLTSDFITYYNGSEYLSQHYGTVYLYREDDTPTYGNQIIVSSTDAAVYLDGVEFISLPERTFIGFKVPVGRYVLQVQKRRRVLEVVANTTHYVLIKQAVYPINYQEIADVDEKSASEKIRKSYTLSEKKIKLKRFEVLTTKPDPK